MLKKFERELPKPRRTREPSSGARVYFLQAASGSIKIGTAINVKRRLREFSTGVPAEHELLASIPGGRALEQELHRSLSHLHIRGEWFRAEPELLQRIAALRAVLGESS